MVSKGPIQVPSFRGDRTDDGAVNSVVESVRRVAAWLQRFPLATFQILDGVSLGAADTPVLHSLGRTPRGFFIVRRNANQTVWETAAPTAQQLTLRAGGAVTVSLFLF